MSAISDFSDRTNAKLDTIQTGLGRVSDDVQFLKDKIDEIQNSPGPISAEDQAALDAIESRISTAESHVAEVDALVEDRPAPPEEPTP